MSFLSRFDTDSYQQMNLYLQIFLNYKLTEIRKIILMNSFFPLAPLIPASFFHALLARSTEEFSRTVGRVETCSLWLLFSNINNRQQKEEKRIKQTQNVKYFRFPSALVHKSFCTFFPLLFNIWKWKERLLLKSFCAFHISEPGIAFVWTFLQFTFQ